MKKLGVKIGISIAVLIFSCFTGNVKVFNNEVKADTNNTQQGVVVRSTTIATTKVIKVPEKQSNKVVTKGSLSRGGSGLGTSSSSSGNSDIVNIANKFLGRPYVWGASGPKAFDCSGFTSYVYSLFGISLPHYTGAQFGEGTYVTKTNLAPGDLVFFNTYGSISHVGIYMGGGDFIHAGSEKTGVTVSNLSDGYYSSRYAGARRISK